MSKPGALEKAAWAATGAAILGGGVFLGLVSALLGKRQKGEPATPAAPAASVAPDPGLRRRVEELAAAVAGLEQRLDTIGAPEAEKLEAVSRRVEQLERRVEQIVQETPAMPAVEQVLAAVEQMVTAKIGGLDERLSDQVHAIELLRHASTQTDALLHRLIQAVEGLAEQTSELTPGGVVSSQ